MKLRIYLNFSDRWPKNRHAKRRLTYHNFSVVSTSLNYEGDLHFKTDNRGLFAYSLESMSQFGMIFYKINLNLNQEDDGSNILTEYENKFSDTERVTYLSYGSAFIHKNKTLTRDAQLHKVGRYNGSIDKVL